MNRTKYVERDEPQAVNTRQYQQMVQLLRSAEDKQELSKISMMFTMDLTYERSDINLAIHTVEMEKGWHQ